MVKRAKTALKERIKNGSKFNQLQSRGVCILLAL